MEVSTWREEHKGSLARPPTPRSPRHPCPHARMLAGEISAHAGMIEAGFCKRAAQQTAAFDQIKKLILKANLSEDERAELIALLTR
jgi:hypothetical protein